MTKLPTLLLAFAACGGTASPVIPPEVELHGPALRVLTYNVNYGMAGDDATIRAMLSADADVILLQETNAAWEASLRPRTERKYPHQRHVDDSAAGGSAILSKHPIISHELLRPPSGGWFDGVHAVIDSPIGPVQVLAVHLRPQLGDDGSVLSGYFSTAPIRRAEIERHSEALDPNLPTLIVGDFNEEDGDALALLEMRGFRSAFERAPDTWRWETSIGALTAALDHIFYSPATLAHRESRVIREGRSDHFPVLGVFTSPPAQGAPSAP